MLAYTDTHGLSQKEFLDCSRGIEFTGEGRGEMYAWVERVLVAQEFGRQKKKERGLITTRSPRNPLASWRGRVRDGIHGGRNPR